MTMNFADKLQSYRKQKGMSQENLADVIGVSRQAVSKWESGQSYPEIDKMIAISELFGVSVDHLVKDVQEEAGGASQAGYVPVVSYAELRSLFHYEYKSKRTLFGLPLVHINVGRGVYVAKGIFAIGTIAMGAVSIGAVALGGLCLGAISLGLFSLAAVALGLLFAGGGLAVGAIAAGGVAVGIFAVGGLSLGMYALGGCAIASKVAVGGYASGHIAIGETAKGAYTFLINSDGSGSFAAEQVKQLVDQEYPGLWKPIKDILLWPVR
jgi:transcriptional regulator with XRE-family HTH domain